MATKRNQVKKEVLLWKSDVDWYNEHYRDTPLSNTLAFMLSEFKKLHGDNSPRVIGSNAARNLKALLENAS